VVGLFWAVDLGPQGRARGACCRRGWNSEVSDVATCLVPGAAVWATGAVSIGKRDRL